MEGHALSCPKYLGAFQRSTLNAQRSTLNAQFRQLGVGRWTACSRKLSELDVCLFSESERCLVALAVFKTVVGSSEPGQVRFLPSPRPHFRFSIADFRLVCRSPGLGGKRCLQITRHTSNIKHTEGG